MEHVHHVSHLPNIQLFVFIDIVSVEDLLKLYLQLSFGHQFEFGVSLDGVRGYIFFGLGIRREGAVRSLLPARFLSVLFLQISSSFAIRHAVSHFIEFIILPIIIIFLLVVNIEKALFGLDIGV